MRRRLVVAYAILVVAAAASTMVSLRAGDAQRPAPSIAGTYTLTQGSPCLGVSGGMLQLKQSGQFVDADTGRGSPDQLRLQGTILSGELHCLSGRSAAS